MADITKCPGSYCLKKETCYRYLAISSEYRQSYFVKLPIDSNGKCDHYWECCPNCLLINGNHKMSCSTQKIQINL